MLNLNLCNAHFNFGIGFFAGFSYYFYGLAMPYYMINLLLSIISSTGILLLFKLMDRNKIALFPPIIINYAVAALLGFYISDTSILSIVNEKPDWLILSVIIGVLLIVNFFFVGNSTKEAGIAVTTVAAKMSFVLPITYSLLFDLNDSFSFFKLIEIGLALVAVILVVHKPSRIKFADKNIIYPMLLFVGLGIIDTLVKYAQHHYINSEEMSSVFSAINFLIAGAVGVVFMVIKGGIIPMFANVKVWVSGILLGIVNFGSMYFLINALNALTLNHSLIFGINNIGIVIFSVMIAFVVFSEKFTIKNWIGLILSLTVLLLMIFSY